MILATKFRGRSRSPHHHAGKWPLDPVRHHLDAWLRGEDEFSMTLAHEADIAAFHARGPKERLWLHAPFGRKAS